MPKSKKTIRRNIKRNNKTKKKNSKIRISSNFESGNIIHKSTINNDVILEIKEEPYPKNTKRKYKNWFYFKASNIKQKTNFIIKNIRDYDGDWKGFNICYSYNNKTWKRFKTEVDIKNKELKWSIDPKKSTVWFAYYPPYPFSKSKKLLPNMKIIGRTKNKKPILMTTLGNGPIKIWLISGQHSGETINSWILEGFVKRVLERKSKLFNRYTFFIIPNANPDGNVKGHWYVTSKGINLNRDWKTFKAPETKIIKKYLDNIGYFLVFDIHGDEGSKNHFLVSSYKNKHPLHDEINKRINKKNKHFQLKNHYSEKYMKGAKDTLDDYTKGITIEGAMKHPLFSHKTLQDEPLKIGMELADIFVEL